MADKQGEVKKITQKDAPEFKGEGEEVRKASHEFGVRAERENKDEVKRTSILTMQNKKPRRIYFENGKQVKIEDA